MTTEFKPLMNISVIRNLTEPLPPFKETGGDFVLTAEAVKAHPSSFSVFIDYQGSGHVPVGKRTADGRFHPDANVDYGRLGISDISEFEKYLAESMAPNS